MLIARPATLAGIFDGLDELPGVQLLAGGTDATVGPARRGLATSRRATGLALNRIPVRPDDIARSAEPAASTG